MKVHEVFAYLRVDDAARAIEFYEKAFDVTEKFRLTEPSGRIGHAELDFGGATIMLSDEYPEYGIKGPKTVGGTCMSIHLHVDDADEFIRRAVAAGAEVVRPPQDQFYGERSGTVRDPFGHEWNIGHHIEDVTPVEMQRRYDEMMRGA
ncbi:MAG TPA: VOC family protein [Candidatus Binatia bacterium]|nr:VOC family protein [Candidatus Binatia bacterium]